MAGRLGVLTARAKGLLGTPADVLLGHTVLGYYLRLRTDTERAAVIDRLTLESPRHLKSQLGWLATRMGAAHPLKACDACCLEDFAEHQCTTWRLAHQLPGVWVCPTHRLPLWTTNWKTTGIQRFDWLLPDDVPEAARFTCLSPGGRCGSTDVAWGIAASSAELLADATGLPMDPCRLALALLRGLKDRRLAAPNGRLHIGELGRQFAAYVAPLGDLPEASALCISNGAAEALWHRLLRPGKRSLHPIRYILAANWLFGGWAQCVHAYEEAGVQRALEPREATGAVNDAPQSTLRETFLTLFAETHSAAAAAKAVGVDTETGLVWAAAAGMTVARRPKKLTEESRQAIVRALAAGRPKEAIAERHAVSVVTVARILLSVPGLHDRRQARLLAKRRDRARQQVSGLTARRPAISIKELRERLPAAFAWLYRNDLAWLRAQTATLQPASRRPPVRVDWQARDREFVIALDQALRLGDHLDDDPRPHAPGDLIRSVPGLRQKLRHLDRMPMTAAVLAVSGAGTGKER